MITEIRIRAFRATDDIETCLRFIDGHKKVLENHGIKKVTSSNSEWINSKAVFVVVVETLDGKKLYGGARIHAADGITPLPIEKAIGQVEPRIYDYIRGFSLEGTGELCGLWNSIEVAGLGIGSLFPSKVSVVIAEQIGLASLFSLCSPNTVRFNQWIGSRVFNEVGNNGTFYYPKLDLLATAVFLDDVKNLPLAHPRERQKMLFLRENLDFISIEKSPFKDLKVTVHHDIALKNVSGIEFKMKYQNPNP